MGEHLRRSLEWWSKFLEQVPTRCAGTCPSVAEHLASQYCVCRIVPMRAKARNRILVYSDATGGGKLAWVIEAGEDRRFASTDAPAALRGYLKPRKTQALPPAAVLEPRAFSCAQVTPFELVAALTALEEALKYEGDLEVRENRPAIHGAFVSVARSSSGSTTTLP